MAGPRMRRHLPAITLAVSMLLAGAFLAFYLHQDVKNKSSRNSTSLNS